jgi:guanine deaminase
LSLMKKNGVFIAHCPQSNTNLSSGIAPVRRYLDEGLSVGLGSDVAGGSVTNLFTAMKDALQASKLRWRLADSSLKPLTFENVFYMATKGGGAFFGRAGSFEAGYEFDAVVLDDSNQDTMRDLTTKERLERLMYFADDRNIQGKYVRGSRLY